MNWLITGGCGFIGTNLIKSLLKEKNNNIRIIDNLSAGSRNDLLSVCKHTEIQPSNIADNINDVELIVGDILDAEMAIKISKNIDVIVHLAANTGVVQSVENPRLDCLVNVVGTLNYLEAARINNVSKFILASSGAPIGEVDPPIHEELSPHPVSPYGASKLAGEGYCSAYNKTFGIQTVMLRFGNVYGPGSKHKGSVVAKFIRQAINKETLELYGDGKQSRDFIYIDDLIVALRLAVSKKNIGGETFQIATNHETTVAEITEKLIKILKKYGLNDITVVNGNTRLGDVKRNYSDTTKARNMLGWQPTTSQEDGLKTTVEYFIK